MSIRTIFVSGSNQGEPEFNISGLGMNAVHQLAATPNVLVFMGSRKLAAAEEARAKFASDIHASSSVVPVQLDLCDTESIKNAHDSVAKVLKEKNLGLDVLVNNAAVAGAFTEVYAVNVIGTAALTEAMLPLINKGGAILNISSELGSLIHFTKRPPPPIHLAYSSSKAALNSLTLQWGIQEEEKGSGIRVVSICPGFNATKLNGYTGTMQPSEGAKFIVKNALEKDGKSSVFIHANGEYPW
ncbi:3-oxoacyl-reductase [Mycena belliarum]|uniref:3-oxoacyl-reductase n=1 Tax=Mycena belliarum TaxID=1033014 RepID=A0AAD6TUB1_9AGAR|nr:3-oxoacyl-reductase [Mycena belliae]